MRYQQRCGESWIGLRSDHRHDGGCRFRFECRGSGRGGSRDRGCCLQAMLLHKEQGNGQHDSSDSRKRSRHPDRDVTNGATERASGSKIRPFPFNEEPSQFWKEMARTWNALRFGHVIHFPAMLNGGHPSRIRACLASMMDGFSPTEGPPKVIQISGFRSSSSKFCRFREDGLYVFLKLRPRQGCFPQVDQRCCRYSSSRSALRSR